MYHPIDFWLAKLQTDTTQHSTSMRSLILLPQGVWFALFLFVGTAYFADLQLNLVFSRRNNGVIFKDHAKESSVSKPRLKKGYRFVWEGGESTDSSDDQGDVIDDDDDSANTETEENGAPDPVNTKKYENGNSNSEKKRETNADNEQKPKIAWLASYPNSGTSYTMTMVERSTNLSTATNYGLEIAYQRDDSIPVHDKTHPEGPYWEGLSGKRGTTIRDLPDTYVLTKTHCGGRCINCPATEWKTNATSFIKACQKTSAYRNSRHVYGQIDASRVARVIHLIRNPFHNIVARFHLERRHLVQKNAAVDAKIPNNATGFHLWCDYLDTKYGGAEEDEAKVLPNDIVSKMKRVSCHAEWYKYVQWHNLLIEIMPRLGDTFQDTSDKLLVVHYENYEHKLNETVDRIMDFLGQKVVRPLRPFRALPSYADHYSAQDRVAAYELAKAVASPETWELIRHYFTSDDQDKDDDDKEAVQD